MNKIQVISVKSVNYKDSELSDCETNNNFTNEENKNFVTPGDLITEDPLWMKGHGTYSYNDKSYSSFVGQVSCVNKLLSVIPLNGRYYPEIGDHVVGRVTEVGNKRWKVDLGGRQDAVLLLGSVNLPGGILRRKSENDELRMRLFLKEGDLLNAEVQMFFNNDIPSLHTRSLKYGKLRNGIFLKVPCKLISKSKNHSIDLKHGISIILGINGYFWIKKTDSNSLINSKTQTNLTTLNTQETFNYEELLLSVNKPENEFSWNTYNDNEDMSVSNFDRLNIYRYYNVLKSFSFFGLNINEQRINMGYDASFAYFEDDNMVNENMMMLLCKDVLNREIMI